MKMSLFKRLERWVNQALCSHEVTVYKSKSIVGNKLIKKYECLECEQEIKVERKLR